MEYIDRRKQQIQRAIRQDRDQEDWNEVHEQMVAVQKKSLEVSDPNDADEKEADAVARKVSDGESAEIHGTGGTINRKGEGAAETTPAFNSRLESSKGGGQSLDDSTKSEMESQMGADFGDVKIHTGSEANEMNESVNAKAFTHGQDIYFGEGNYNTTSGSGKELLAHELVHTVQQGMGVKRMIQRVVSDDDMDNIVKHITPHFIKATELQRNAVLRILSNPENTSDDIITAWRTEKLNKHLDYFVDSFRRVSDFDEFTMEILATFQALESPVRVSKISSLLNETVSSDEAVRILYLMQGLPGEDLEKAFNLDKDKGNPTKFELFKMALPPGETERVQLSYQHSINEPNVDLELIDSTANKVYETLGIDRTKIPEKPGVKQERKQRKLAKKTADKDVDPVNAVKAYRLIKSLYNVSPETEEEFGFRYPLLYSKVMESLPVEFMHSSEFGMQKVVHDPKEVEKENTAYHLLYKLAKPYRFLYNNPEALANIMELQGKVNADNRELQKEYLFDERRKKVETERDSNSALLTSAIQYLKVAVPGDFVPPGETEEFNAGLDAILKQIAESQDPMLQNLSWIYLPNGEINHLFFLSVLSGMFDKRINSAVTDAKAEEEKARFKNAKDLLSDQPQLYGVLIGSPLPVENASAQLAETLENDANLLTIYNQDPGVFQLMSDPQLWEGTPAANARLDTALTIMVAGGYGQQLASFVEGKKLKNDTQKEDEHENESVLRKHGFADGKYVEKTWDTTQGATSTVMDVGGIVDNLVNDQLISLYPKKKNKIPGWRPRTKLLMLLLHPVKFARMLQAAVYGVEGLFLPAASRLNSRIGRRAHYDNLDLVSVQEGMGDQIYGMEFGSESAQKNKALMSVDINELTGVANMFSPSLNIKRMNMQYPDMLFTSGAGEFVNMFARIVWPPDAASEAGSTLMVFQSLELNQLLYQDKESITSVGKISLKNLAVYSDKPIANYTQMNNWYKLFFSVMQFIQDVLSLIISGVQVSAQRYAPDMIKTITDPASNPENPEKALSEFLLQRLTEDQTITIDYESLNIENLFMNDMGLIDSFATGTANMTSSNYAIGKQGEREMHFGFSGQHMQINGADISGFKSDALGADGFKLGMYFNDPSSGIKNGREKATLQSLSQLSSQEHPTQVSKLKKMDFDLSGMAGDGLSLIGLDMATLPFTDIAGVVEFVNGVPKVGDVDAVSPKVHITISKVSNVNIFGLPFPADNSFRLVSDGQSKLMGDIINADIMLTLNDEADQVLNGWDIKEVRINSLTIPKLQGNNFSIVTQGSEIKVDKGGTITNIVLTDFVMLPNAKDDAQWDIKKLNLATGGVDMQGIGIKTAAGISADLHKFGAGGLTFGMVVTDSVEDNKSKQVTGYTYGASNVNTTGHIDYTSPEDRYDKSKKPVSVGADLDMENNNLGGTYTTTSVNGMTTGSIMTMNSTVQLLSIPMLNVKSDTMQIIAPEAGGHPILLDTVSADVEVSFNEFGDATEFTIKSVLIGTTSTHGLLIKKLATDKNLVDLPENVASTISGFYIKDMKMQTRKFTPYEIDEMKRDKVKNNTPMPDENQTWDFKQETKEEKKGENKVGFTSSNLPGGLKLAIGESIGVEMTKATSGAVSFSFVTINDFSYSIADLDASGLQIKKDGETIFRGDLDSESATGTYKQEIIDSGLEARKKTTLTGTINIPDIQIHKLYIASNTSLIEIPEDAAKTSSITKVTGSYTVTIIGPSEKEKIAIEAAAVIARNKLDSKQPMSERERRNQQEIAAKTAQSEVEMKINSLDIEKMQGYGLHIKSTSETEVKKSITPGGKNIETYDSKKYELKLRKDTAATINNLHLEDFKVHIPANDKEKMVMSAPEDGSGFVIGGKKDDEGNVIPGIDIGTAEIITSSVRHLLQGTKETTPPNVNNTYATTSVEVSKLSFGGSTEGEYTVIIDDPKFWFPENRTGKADNVSSNTLDYDLDETYEWDGTPKIDNHTNTSVLLHKLANRETPVLQADSIIIKRVKKSTKGPNGEDLFETKVMVINPVLQNIDIKTKMVDAVKPGELQESILTIGGKVNGTLEVNFEKADFSENVNSDFSPDMHDAIVIKPADGSTISFNEITQTDPDGTKMVMNFVPDPVPHGILPQNHAEWVAERRAEQVENNDFTETGITDTPQEIVDRYNNINLHGSAEEVRKRHSFDFLDGATSGNVVLTLFGTPVTINIVDAINAQGQTKHGYINIVDAVAEIRTILLTGNRITDPIVFDVIDGLGVDTDDPEGYSLEAYVFSNNVQMLIPRGGDNILEDAEGNEVIRLAEMLNFLSNQPRHVSETDPDDFAGQVASAATLHTSGQLMIDWMNGGVFVPTVALNNVVIDFNQIDKQHRGMMSFINGDKPVTLNVDAGFNDNPYTRTQAEVAAFVPQTTTQGLTGKISDLSLPDVRVPSKNSDKAITSVFSADKIHLTNLSFEYENFKMEKLTLIPTGIDITKFRYDIKK